MKKPLVKTLGISASLLAGMGLVSCNSSDSSSAGAGVPGTAASCNASSRATGRAMHPEVKIEEGEAFLEQVQAVSKRDGQALTKLHGHIPRAIKNFADQGKLSDQQSIAFSVALPLNNETELDQRIADMYEPGNPNFHKFISSQEFQAKYAPTDAQVQQVQQLLAEHGIAAGEVSGNHVLVHAQGTVGQLNGLFNTELHQYKAPAGSEAEAKASPSEPYFSPAYELQVPSGMPIQAVLGLQNVTRAHAQLQKLPEGTSPKGGTGPNGGVSPADLHNAYSVPTNLNGKGETMALFELDGYDAQDITAYESKFGLPNVPLENVMVDGATGSAGGGQDEVTLDIELMIALAPGANKVLVYEGPNSSQGIIDTYNKIATDNRAREVSSSWGSSEGGMSSSDLQAENTIFKQMAAQGQSIYAAAGDDGANDNGSSLSVDDPGSQPYVVAVGGTSLSLTSSGGYQSETSWNVSSTSAGGGGISSVWSIPTWQQGIATSANLGSNTMRNTPDVSLEADPTNGYSIYVGGAWTTFGGTSCAAPLWAAFTALVNQQRLSTGMSPLGYPNPTIYQIAKTSRYSSDFHDIADGSTNGHYPATAGYDNTTGWGSFQGSNLISDLAKEPAPACGT